MPQNRQKSVHCLDTEISDLAIELAKFNLEEDEYLKDPQDIQYDPQVQLEIEDHIGQTEATNLLLIKPIWTH